MDTKNKQTTETIVITLCLINPRNTETNLL